MQPTMANEKENCEKCSSNDIKTITIHLTKLILAADYLMMSAEAKHIMFPRGTLLIRGFFNVGLVHRCRNGPTFWLCGSSGNILD